MLKNNYKACVSSLPCKSLNHNYSHVNYSQTKISWSPLAPFTSNGLGGTIGLYSGTIPTCSCTEGGRVCAIMRDWTTNVHRRVPLQNQVILTGLRLRCHAAVYKTLILQHTLRRTARVRSTQSPVILKNLPQHTKQTSAVKSNNINIHSSHTL